MLLKSKISDLQLSLDPVLNERYEQAKLGRFTSSEFHYLMGEKGIGQTGLNYIYRKVGEVMTGKKSRPDISTAATEHGLTYEREALTKFGEQIGVDSILVQRLILSEDGVSGGTPDGLIILNESTDGLYYNVKTVECKCPLSFDGHIRLWKCKTPMDLKKECREYFVQVLHQMYLCDSLNGVFLTYHPFFKFGQMRIIEFRKVDLISEFKLISDRTKEAVEIFNNIVKQLKNDV